MLKHVLPGATSRSGTRTEGKQDCQRHRCAA